jgi:glycosyltransferase involved in cell wall biosynthesis
MPGPGTSSTSEPAGLALVTWSNTAPTGGNVYNTELVGALCALGVDTVLRTVDGSWPGGSADDHRRLAGALSAGRLNLVDGIVASGAPEVVRAAASRVAVLVHMPIADEVGLDAATRDVLARAERRSLSAAACVICPSTHARDRLQSRYGLRRVYVAEPGVRPAAPASGSVPPRLLCLGAVTPNKNQLALLAALQRVADLPWSARIVGSLTAAPGYASRVLSAISGLRSRVELTGVLTGAALDAEWDAADLLVHCARNETYGMVVTEALARGIPALVPAGTGAVEALGSPPPGRAVTEHQLPDVLRNWLADAALRSRWKEAARVRRLALPGWDLTARQVIAALTRSGLQPGLG